MAQLPGGPVRTGDLASSLMPDAVYTFRIDRAEIKKAQGEGKEPYINLMLKCVDEGEWLGRAVWDILTLAKGKTFKLDQLLKDALGWGEDDTLDDTDQLLQLEVCAAITTEKGQAGYSDRNKVVKYLPSDIAR